jgi:GNAT superfamily N-acetyltransferase
VREVDVARTFRRATAQDTDLLNELTLAGVRHWGHHEHFPDAYADLASDLPSQDDTVTNPVFVLEEDGRVIAFYDLRPRGDHVELLRMFQDPALVGTGIGRMLWEHAVAQARGLADRMLIMSDPEAVGFYQAMGATLEEHVEVSPGFHLGVCWYSLRD